MSELWYYARNGQQFGPLLDEQLRQMLSAGQLAPTDLVWKDGMAQWASVGEVFGAMTPPPLPTGGVPPASPAPGPNMPSMPGARTAFGAPNFAKLKQNPLAIGYLVALAIAVVAVLLPWYSVTFRGGSPPGMTFGVPRGFSMPTVKNSSVSGVDLTCGTVAMITALGGIVFAVLNPGALLRHNARYAMGAIGAVVLLCAAISLARILSASDGGFSGVTAGAGIGLYLTLLAGIVATALGAATDWETTF